MSIANALQMVSGVDFMPGNFDWKGETVPAARIYQASIVGQRYRYIKGANSLIRKIDAGTKFGYSDMDAALVGGVIENAGQRHAWTVGHLGHLLMVTRSGSAAPSPAHSVTRNSRMIRSIWTR